MTTYVAWKEFYRVGEKSLDAEHRQIIRIINEVYQAIEQNTDRKVVAPILDELVQYTTAHFTHEEAAMRAHGYPEFARHRAIHERLRQRTADLRENAELVTARDLLHFAKQWWLEHIQEKDKQYGPYLKEPAAV